MKKKKKRKKYELMKIELEKEKMKIKLEKEKMKKSYKLIRIKLEKMNYIMGKKNNKRDDNETLLTYECKQGNIKEVKKKINTLCNGYQYEK